MEAFAPARGLAWLFTATIFLNAALLFAVQPMFSRMVLPLLGGSSSVWTTCMLFFQAVLLAGYLYAHVLPRWIGDRRHALVHAALLLISVSVLPIAARGAWDPAAYDEPVLPLLGLLATSLGIPFFLLSSGSPLLQRWFSRTRHPSAHNPYFLYAASNLGSMVALLAYPLLLEPTLRLADQSRLWTYGYWALVAITAVCVATMRRGGVAGERVPAPLAINDEDAPPLAARQRARWVLLAFAPSSLMLGVTTFLTTDIASAPLLWVLPLALYLLTFVIAFARRPLITQAVALRVQPYLLLPLVVILAVSTNVWPTAFLPLHLAAFFVCALVCHMELARTRPHVRHLTGFYLWISVGGVLGGAFNVLIAPHAFSTVAEYPIAIALAAMLRPEPPGATRRERALDAVLPVVLFLAMAGAMALYPDAYRTAALMAIGCIAAAVVFGFQRRPLRFGLGLGAVLLAGALLGRDAELVHVERSFFGVHRIERDPAGYHLLVHGTTIHGAQSLAPDERLEPLAYYHTGGPLGEVFDAVPRRGERRVAVVGLGTGSMACHGAPGERWTFHEIDPAVERIARDPALFTFLADCPPDSGVVIGDARLTLAADRTGPYDLIVLDAFSSDAIPVHLLTRESLALYLDRLAPDGLLAFHISNRHLDLQPVVAALAAEAALTGRHRYDPSTAEQVARYRTGSHWAVLARSEQNLGAIAHDERWSRLDTHEGVEAWTDDFSNILEVLRVGAE